MEFENIVGFSIPDGSGMVSQGLEHMNNVFGMNDSYEEIEDVGEIGDFVDDTQ